MMRELITNAVREGLRGERPVALCFSGGTDSTVLLLACLDLLIEPVLYTYRRADVETQDVQHARAAAAYFGLTLHEALIPVNPADVERDARALIALGIKGKVCIQCMHGHMYVAPLVREPVILNGSGVDGLYGAYREMKIIGPRDLPGFNDLRKSHLLNPNDDAMEYQTAMYVKHGSRVVYPYRDRAVVAYLMAQSYQQMNKPRLKWVTVRDYEAEFRGLGRYYRPRGSQQIEAGTRSLHDALLTMPVNKRKRTRVADLYRDMAAEAQ